MRKGMMSLPKEFGDQVLVARTSQRLSQTELAARSKVSSRTICEVEVGKRQSLRRLVVLKIVLGVEPKDATRAIQLLRLAGFTLQTLNDLREELIREIRR